MLIEMELREILTGVDIDPTIVLAEKNGKSRHLPILIGPYEVQMLEWAVFKKAAPRPLTHDLVLNVINGMGGKLHRVIVDQMSEDKSNMVGFYHGKLDVELNDHTRTWIDSRPSDAIVLAAKLSLPIFVEEDVLHQPESPPEEGDEQE